jgi:hypothetical protein
LLTGLLEDKAKGTKLTFGIAIVDLRQEICGLLGMERCLEKDGFKNHWVNSLGLLLLMMRFT